MSMATLYQSNWGYLPAEARLRISAKALSMLFEKTQLLENVRLSTPDPLATRRISSVTSRQHLDDLLRHFEGSVVAVPARHNSSLLGFGKLLVGDDDWVEYRAEKLLLRISAVDSLSRFLGRSGQHAVRNMDAVIALAARMVEETELKECVGYRGDRVTFFAGEPTLLYRPPLLERFYRDRRFEDAIEPFWRMYSELAGRFPLDDVLGLVRASAVDFRELRNGKIMARFGWCLDDLRVDGREVFREVKALVDPILIDQGSAIG